MKHIFIYVVIIFVYIGCGTTQVQYVDVKPHKNNSVQNSVYKKGLDSVEYNIPNQSNNRYVESNRTKQIVENNTIVLFYSSSKIGKYAIDVTNTINTYLLYKNIDFELLVYDIDKIGIENIVENIEKNSITKVVAMITKEDIKFLEQFDQTINIYLPLINKENISTDITFGSNILFGGISYKKQFEMLLKNKKGHISELYSNSYIGDSLHKYMQQYNLKYSKQIKNKRPNYKKLLKDKSLSGSYLVLNTPIIQSSIILSQLRALRVNIKGIISTQLNYTPLLFSLTQKGDRKNITISSSIGYIPNNLIEYNNIIGNNISYSWVNYSATLGVEYLLEKSLERYPDISIEDNQIIYTISLYVVNKHSFRKIK